MWTHTKSINLRFKSVWKIVKASGKIYIEPPHKGISIFIAFPNQLIAEY